jgi:hypothetical protein
MARGGRGKGNDNLLALGAGAVAAAIVDFAAEQYQIAGGNTAFGPGLSMSDVIQMAATAGVTLYGFTAGGGSRVPAFGFGGFLTQIMMKVIFPARGIPRYIIFDKGGRPLQLPGAGYARGYY